MKRKRVRRVRPYGELWIQFGPAQWVERFWIKSGFPGGYHAAWQHVKDQRLACLAPGVNVIGERGPCDADWFPAGPGQVLTVSNPPT